MCLLVTALETYIFRLAFRYSRIFLLPPSWKVQLPTNFILTRSISTPFLPQRSYIFSTNFTINNYKTYILITFHLVDYGWLFILLQGRKLRGNHSRRNELLIKPTYNQKLQTGFSRQNRHHPNGLDVRHQRTGIPENGISSPFCFLYSRLCSILDAFEQGFGEEEKTAGIWGGWRRSGK
jgi:hypothetical protein